MVEAVAKGTLVPDVVAADTETGEPPCIMGTFLEGKSCKQKYTEEQWSHIHTRQMREGERERETGSRRGIQFNWFPFFPLLPLIRGLVI